MPRRATYRENQHLHIRRLISAIRIPTTVFRQRISDNLRYRDAQATKADVALIEHGAGALAGSADIITEPAHKQALNQSSGAIAVDMETDILVYLNNAMDMYGNINPARMLSLLLRHPASWLHLMRLGRQFSTATSILSLVSGMAGADFLLPPTLSD